MSLKYNYDVLLEILGGYTYYSKEQVDYIFYDVNKLDPVKTKILLDQCLESAEIINNKYSKLVSDEYCKEALDNRLEHSKEIITNNEDLSVGKSKSKSKSI